MGELTDGVGALSVRSATLSYALQDVPEKEDVIELFAKHCMMCLASGAVNHLFKFYFFAEMVRLATACVWLAHFGCRSLSLSCVC